MASQISQRNPREYWFKTNLDYNPDSYFTNPSKTKLLMNQHLLKKDLFLHKNVDQRYLPQDKIRLA